MILYVAHKMHSCLLYGGKDYVADKVYVYSIRRDIRITALCSDQYL